MRKRKSMPHRMCRKIMKSGLFFVLAGLFIGGIVLPAYAKEGDDDQMITRTVVSEDGQTIVEETIIFEDGEEIYDTTEILSGVEDNLKALKEIPFSYNTNTGVITFTREKAYCYRLRIQRKNGSSTNTTSWSFGSGWQGEYQTNVSNIVEQGDGSYVICMYAFNNEKESSDYANAVAKSKDIGFNYARPGKRLATPSKPALTLRSESGSQWVEVSWNRVDNAYDYEFRTNRCSNNRYTWSAAKDNNSSAGICFENEYYMNKGESYYFTVFARPNNVNEYQKSYESEKSDYINIDLNGNVTISSQPLIVVPDGVSLNYDSLTLQKGESRKVTATVTPDNASDKSVKWATGNSAIATVDQNGNVKAVAVGSTTLTATTSNGISKSIPVKVIVNPTSIKLNKTSATMYYGNEMTLTATLAPSDVTEKTITWTSSNPAVATVNNGVVKAKGGGKTTITAKTVNGLTATCSVAVAMDNDPSNPFADLKAEGWQYNAARYVYDNGYMKGKGEVIPGKVLFAPNEPIDRSQFVQTLYNFEGRPAVTYVQKFSDVKSTDWFAKPVTWAAQNQIVGGNPDGTFGVTGKATREQMARMFYSYAAYKGYDTSIVPGQGKRISDFSDGSLVSSWAETALNWALSHGVMSGKGNNKLDPKGSATRVECATMLRNFKNAFNGVPLTFGLASDGIEEEEFIVENVDEEIVENDVTEEEIIEEVTDEEIVNEDVVVDDTKKEIVNEEVVTDEVVNKNDEVINKEVVNDEVVTDENVDEE